MSKTGVSKIGVSKTHLRYSFQLPSGTLNVDLYTLGRMLVAGTDERVTAAQEG